MDQLKMAQTKPLARSFAIEDILDLKMATQEKRDENEFYEITEKINDSKEKPGMNSTIAGEINEINEWVLKNVSENVCDENDRNNTENNEICDSSFYRSNHSKFFTDNKDKYWALQNKKLEDELKTTPKADFANNFQYKKNSHVPVSLLSNHFLNQKKPQRKPFHVAKTLYNQQFELQNQVNFLNNPPFYEMSKNLKNFDKINFRHPIYQQPMQGNSSYPSSFSINYLSLWQHNLMAYMKLKLSSQHATPPNHLPLQSSFNPSNLSSIHQSIYSSMLKSEKKSLSPFFPSLYAQGHPPLKNMQKKVSESPFSPQEPKWSSTKVEPLFHDSIYPPSNPLNFFYYSAEKNSDLKLNYENSSQNHNNDHSGYFCFHELIAF